jgi:hypothetical protein
VSPVPARHGIAESLFSSIYAADQGDLWASWVDRVRSVDQAHTGSKQQKWACLGGSPHLKLAERLMATTELHFDRELRRLDPEDAAAWRAWLT